MSFGVSFGDITAIVQLFTETHQRLHFFTGTIKGLHYTIRDLEIAVIRLGVTFSRLGPDDFNELNDNETNELNQIAKISIELDNSILRALDLERPSQLLASSNLRRRAGHQPGGPNTVLLVDVTRDINEVLRRLELLFSQILE
jgi:hypothetical protein